MSTDVFVIGSLMLLAILFLMAMFARLYRKAGPHEALVVYGFRGTRIVKGRGTVIFPMVENCRCLSLELMSFDVAPQQDLYTRQGVAVTVEAVAQIKVKSDPESVQTAAEQFLTKTPQEREGLIRLVMEGHLRGIIGQLTVEEIVKQPEMVGDRMRSTCADDMSKMGLEVISFTIKEVRDKNEYISNMGRPDIARIRRDADVAAAEAERDTAIKRAEAQRAAAVGKALADQERVLAETLSQAKQAEATRDLEIKRANFTETIKKQQAQADKAYEIQTNVMQQQVVAEQVRIQQVEKEREIDVQEAEIMRRERELIATVLKQAEIERKRIETLAEAERQRLITEAEGQAAAIRAQGEAEAEIIFKKGEAEARAMNVKAEAYQQYNQAAVIDKLITGLPEVVRALSAPLANVDKITVVSTGDGHAAGLHKVTGDISQIAAQVPALFETLSGMRLSDLLGKIRTIGDSTPRPDKQ
ncbi:MAG TPA: SPFH domain-containing protein [Bryobacteraceae bacterium]|nr:SPFH domain-containing protein [Bryobacteraceae bacterium]